jgi:cell division protein FtsI (penicillin-binding protein 3)
MRRGKPDSRAAKPDRSRLERRRLIVGAVCFLWFICIAARLYYFQVIQYVDMESRAQRQRQRVIEVAPQRGVIYDRQMNALAMSMDVESVFAVPSEIAESQKVASRLAQALAGDADDLRDRFQTARSFCWVRRRVTTAEAARVRALNVKGIYFQTETKRFYPKGDLAGQTIGYVGLDDKGLGGIEYALDDKVKGKPGRVLLASDARRRAFHSTDWAGVPGKNVVLTLDEKIQYIATKALAEEVASAHAAGGVAVVQNPNTGEILALTSQPTFDPNNIDASPAATRQDRGVGWIYEPGSTFKAVTLSAALEEKLTNPEEVINCQNGGIVLAGHTIHDHKPYGDLSVTDVMVNSSDVGAVKLGLRLGEDRFYRYIQAFGFGAKTDVELPGEERGLLKPPSRWSGLSIGEISIGQEISVTPIQMVTAYSAIANGGILFQPRIVHDIFLGIHHDPLAPATGRRVISAHTAETMRQILAQVVSRGTGKPAQLGGYTSAGKTGTAQKVDANGAYSKSVFVGSFIGFAPVMHPAVTILVAIDSPVGAHYGTDVAAPVFRSIAEQTLGYLNVPQDNPSQWPRTTTPKPAKIPDQKPGILTGYLPLDRESLGVATSPVERASLSNQSSPDGTAQPGPDDWGRASRTVVLGDGPQVTVPDFSRWAARRVAQECVKLGLYLNVVGSGLAVEQNPVAGAKVPSGTRIWVRMAR